MLQFVMLLLTAQPALPPASALPAVPRDVYLSALGCEQAAGRMVLPPGYRLACVPVDAPQAAQMASAY